jgi:hypothetical protein
MTLFWSAEARMLKRVPFWAVATLLGAGFLVVAFAISVHSFKQTAAS